MKETGDGSLSPFYVKRLRATEDSGRLSWAFFEVFSKFVPLQGRKTSVFLPLLSASWAFSCQFLIFVPFSCPVHRCETWVKGNKTENFFRKRPTCPSTARNSFRIRCPKGNKILKTAQKRPSASEEARDQMGRARGFSYKRKKRQRTVPCLLAVIPPTKPRSASSRRSPWPGRKCFRQSASWSWPTDTGSGRRGTGRC